VYVEVERVKYFCGCFEKQTKSALFATDRNIEVLNISDDWTALRVSSLQAFVRPIALRFSADKRILDLIIRKRERQTERGESVPAENRPEAS